MWVDKKGRLHLRVTNRDGKWLAAEVACEEALGLGMYVVKIDTALDRLDENVLFGVLLFEYKPKLVTAPFSNYYNEFNLEFGKRRIKSKTNAGYSCPPYEQSCLHPFRIKFDDPKNTKSTHSFRWLNNRVVCKSWYSHATNPNNKQMITYWNYTSSEVPKGVPRLHLNLFMNKKPPRDLKEVEVVVTDFVFTPMGEYQNLPIEIKE